MRLWLAGLLLAAAPAQAARTLTWEEAAALAARGNPDIASARRGEQASRAAYRGSFNSVLPSASLTHSYSESDGASSGSGGSRWQGRGSLSVSLFDMASYAGIRGSAASLASAEATLRAAAATLRFNLRRAFLQLLFAQESLEVSRRIEGIRRRGADLVSLRYESGRESRGNMLRAKAQLLQAEADLAQAVRELRTSQRALTRHLGLSSYEAVVGTGALVAAAPPPLPEGDEAILARRPDFAAQQAALRGAEADLSAARSSLWPALSASFSRTVSGPREFPNSRYGWSAGGTLSYPLFAGGPTDAYYGISAAARRLEAAREDLRAARAEALLDVENAWSDYARAAAQAGVQAALLEAARQRSDEADIRYAGGLLSFDNWEIIGSDRVSQERQALRARLDAGSSEAAWDRALGKALGD